jgi:hypothetical protein
MKNLCKFNDLIHAATWLSKKLVVEEWKPLDIIDTGIPLYVWLQAPPNDTRELPEILSTGCAVRIGRYDTQRLYFEGSAEITVTQMPDGKAIKFSPGLTYSLGDVRVKKDDLRQLAERINGQERQDSPKGQLSHRHRIMNQAALRFWANADRDDPDTHPKSMEVEKWLRERGFGETLAGKAATIIRPEWASKGRKSK